jgi:hypothetical protein
MSDFLIGGFKTIKQREIQAVRLNAGIAASERVCKICVRLFRMCERRNQIAAPSPGASLWLSAFGPAIDSLDRLLRLRRTGPHPRRNLFAASIARRC